jgi:hypothetical protein
MPVRIMSRSTRTYHRQCADNFGRRRVSLAPGRPLAPFAPPASNSPAMNEPLTPRGVTVWLRSVTSIVSPSVEPPTIRGRGSFRSCLVVVACLVAAAIPSISSVVVTAAVSAAPAVEEPVPLAAAVSPSRAVRARADLAVDVRAPVELATASPTPFVARTFTAFATSTREGPPPLRGPPALLH